MTALHVAANGALTRSLVEDVLAEVDRWAEHAPGQAAALHPHDSLKAATSALLDVKEDLADHLCIRLAATLATFGITADGERIEMTGGQTTVAETIEAAVGGDHAMTKSEALELRVEIALQIAREYGQYDGGHHKMWVIDQMVRRLCRDEPSYEAWVASYRHGDDGPDTYSWDEGIAP